jgi:hypothetical protein
VTAQIDFLDTPVLEESRYIPSSEREVATLKLFGDQRGRIPDEAAHELCRDFMHVRPATSILHKQGLLRWTGLTRKARHRPGKELVITPKGLDVLRLLGAA